MNINCLGFFLFSATILQLFFSTLSNRTVAYALFGEPYHQNFFLRRSPTLPASMNAGHPPFDLFFNDLQCSCPIRPDPTRFAPVPPPTAAYIADHPSNRDLVEMSYVAGGHITRPSDLVAFISWPSPTRVIYFSNSDLCHTFFFTERPHRPSSTFTADQSFQLCRLLPLSDLIC